MRRDWTRRTATRLDSTWLFPHYTLTTQVVTIVEERMPDDEEVWGCVALDSISEALDGARRAGPGLALMIPYNELPPWHTLRLPPILRTHTQGHRLQ